MTQDQHKPIPDRLKDEFIGYMQAGYDDDDAPDGAWFARMENDAFDFMRQHKLKGDENSAVHQLLDWMQPSGAADGMEQGDASWCIDPDMGARG